MLTTAQLLSIGIVLACEGFPCTSVTASNDSPSTSLRLADLCGFDLVVAADASPAERFAAEELRDHFARASGTTLSIVTDVERKTEHIFVGSSSAFRSSDLAFPEDQFGPEDFRVLARDRNVAIVGGRPRGTLYGVYDFLEQCLGVRFLTSDHTHVPPLDRDRRVAVERTFHPAFRMRWSYYGEINRDPLFAARKRINTVPEEDRLGGRTGLQNVNHTLYAQIPSQVWGREHPEYFALVDGRRLAPCEDDVYQTQPCFSHPEVRRIVSDEVLKWIDSHPEAENVSVVQNDNVQYCRCEGCAAIDVREESHMGALLEFVNAIAEEVAKVHPRVKVGTLAYQFSRKPPKSLRPGPNVQVELCSIECCQLHSIDDPSCPLNVAFFDELRRWAALCPELLLWHYNTDFQAYLLPCPNLRAIPGSVRCFAQHRVQGLFMQAAGNAVGAELSELRNYLICGLLLDPAADGERLIDEFLVLHYGSAAPPLRRYVDWIHEQAAACGRHHGCFTLDPSDYGLSASRAAEAIFLFDEAMALAADAETLRRVELASIAAYRLAIVPVWEGKGAETRDAAQDLRLRAWTRRFLDLCSAHQVDRAQEWTPFEDDRARLEDWLGR